MGFLRLDCRSGSNCHSQVRVLTVVIDLVSVGILFGDFKISLLQFD